MQGNLTQERKFLKFLWFSKFYFFLFLFCLFFFSSFFLSYLIFYLIIYFFVLFLVSFLLFTVFFPLLFFFFSSFFFFFFFLLFFFRFVSNTAKVSQSLIFSYLAIKDKKTPAVFAAGELLKVFFRVLSSLLIYHCWLYFFMSLTSQVFMGLH